MAMEKAKQIVSSNSVVVFSKSYCPFCVDVKKLLSQLGATFKAIELDTESGGGLLHSEILGSRVMTCGIGDGSEIQTALAQWTGQRTVPNVFVGGKHIGGCDDTTAMHREGKLVPLLTEAGAVSSST